MKLKLSILLLAGIMLFSFAFGCSKPNNDPDSLYIFVEYNGVNGTYDNDVKAEIERKFKEDTGYTLKLVVESAGTDMIGSKITTAISNQNERIDAFMTHYGNEMPLNGYILDGLTVDLTDLAKDFAPKLMANYAANDPSNKSYNSGVFNGKLHAISEITRPSGWGMIINKDYMENTQFDPDDYDITNPNYKSLTFGEFKTLLSELKNNNNDCVRPIVGRPWNIEQIVSPVFGALSYNEYVLDDDGNLIPAYCDEAYLKLLEFQRWLQEEKLWIEAPASMQTPTQYFLSGQGAVNLEWPEAVSQIELSRMAEEQGFECVFVAPLLKEDSATETNGNLKIQPAFSGLTVPSKGKNTELLMRFINWLYTDKENYELAKYGIEGTHWVKSTGTDGRELYGYPTDKVSTFEKNKPYSGKFCFVEDYHISDRLYAGFSEKEISTIDKVRNFSFYPSTGYVTEGMLLPEIPATNYSLKNVQTAFYNEYTALRAYAWSDASMGSKTISSLWNDLVDGMYSDYFSVIEYYTNNYNSFIK